MTPPLRELDSLCEGDVELDLVITGDPCDDPTSPGSTQESERVTSEDRNLDGPDLTTNERALARVLRVAEVGPCGGVPRCAGVEATAASVMLKP